MIMNEWLYLNLFQTHCFILIIGSMFVKVCKNLNNKYEKIIPNLLFQQKVLGLSLSIKLHIFLYFLEKSTTTTQRPTTTTTTQPPTTSTTTTQPPTTTTTTTQPPTTTTTQPPTTTTTTTQPPTTTTTTTQPPTTDSLNVFCDNKIDGNYVHPHRCDQFISCVAQRIVYVRNCPAGLYYNNKLDQCDWPTNVNCPGKQRFSYPKITCITARYVYQDLEHSPLPRQTNPRRTFPRRTSLPIGHCIRLPSCYTIVYGKMVQIRIVC